MNIRIIRRFGTSKLNQPFLQKYRQFNPRPLSASDLLLFSNNNSVEDSFEYLKQELPTRWMQMYAEIVAMPIEKPTPLMMAVSDSIHETLLHLLDFADKPANENVISKFNSKLGDYLQRHRTAVDEVALAILEYKDEQIEMEEQGLTTFDLDDAEEKVHYFLDRYFTTLISTNLIIHQHLILCFRRNPVLNLGMNRDRHKRETVQNTNISTEIRKLSYSANVFAIEYIN